MNSNAHQQPETLGGIPKRLLWNAERLGGVGDGEKAAHQSASVS